MNNTKGYSSNSESTPAIGERESHVEQELGQVDEQLLRLEEGIGRLWPKLQKVLAQETPTKEGEQKVPEPYCVPLADRIRTVGKRVGYFAASIENVLSRIEL